MRTIYLIIAALVAVPVAADSIHPSDLVYEGVIAPPKSSGERYGRGLWGMDYDPTCAGRVDPSPSDGYPGCIAGTSHKSYDKVGMFEIVPPTKAHGGDYNLVPKGQVVVEFFKCSMRSNGSDIQAELDAEEKWVARDIPGIVRTNERWICTCGHDWYDVNWTDYDSHCWFDFDPDAPDAVGAWGLGEVGDDEFHSQRMAWYLGTIPQGWADLNLGANGEQHCFSGFQRKGGGNKVSSTGPTLYSFPCAEPTTPAPGPILGTKQILGYPNVSPISTIDPPHPDFSPDSQAQGAVWIDETVLISALKGGGHWWYGKQDPWTHESAHRSSCLFNAGNPVWSKDGTPCVTEWYERGLELPVGTYDHCDSGKGYHSPLDPDGSGGPQRVATIQFYDATTLALADDPSDPLPYATIETPEGWWGSQCQGIRDMAYDPQSKRLYVVEPNSENPLIHVYAIGGGSEIPFCGDGTCDFPDETVCNCPTDCGPPPPENCVDGVDNDCDGFIDCDDEDCVATDDCAPPVDCAALRVSCQQYLELCECSDDR